MIDQDEPHKATCPEVVLWLHVLNQAITDTKLLLAAIERNPDVSFNYMFQVNTNELKQWFNSKQIRIGSIKWICLLNDVNQEKLVKKMNDDYFSKIHQIIKENKHNEKSFFDAKKAELLRKKEIAKQKRLGSDCCGDGDTDTPVMIFSDWLPNNTHEKPKRPTTIRICKHHGETEFASYERINKKTDYTCLTCRISRQEKINEKRRKESAEMRQLRTTSQGGVGA